MDIFTGTGIVKREKRKKRRRLICYQRPMKRRMRFLLESLLLLFISLHVGCESASCAKTAVQRNEDLSKQNLKRAMQLTDSAISAYFVGEGMRMARYYNPYTQQRSSETASVWMYGSSMEAVTAILKSLIALKKKGKPQLYQQYYRYYVNLLKKLYKGADYYRGGFELTSFTQTREWTIYAVNRADKKEHANVRGKQNVYDDQMWLIRNYIEAFQVTKDSEYLHRATYLTSYVLDGWDACRDKNGEEIGGIPWGPGYVTKHACSNGPLINSLAWFHQFYNGTGKKIKHHYIDQRDKETRRSKIVKKTDYYLTFAQKVYDWEKEHLLNPEGLYDDMMGGCSPCKPTYDTVDGVRYRKSSPLTGSAGSPISYNSGTMLSGGALLYEATQQPVYLSDVKQLSDASFQYFAKKGADVRGYYTYDVSGFNDWFNAVLLQGYMDVWPVYKGVSAYIESFQKNLDFAYKHYLYKGFLPVNLLKGWKEDRSKAKIEGMFMFAYAKEYALLSQYELVKNKS